MPPSLASRRTESWRGRPAREVGGNRGLGATPLAGQQASPEPPNYGRPGSGSGAAVPTLSNDGSRGKWNGRGGSEAVVGSQVASIPGPRSPSSRPGHRRVEPADAPASPGRRRL